MTNIVPAPGPHGGDGPAVARALGIDPATVVDLSMSLNPFAPDAGALASRHAGAVGRYPDRAAATAALAQALGVDPARLVLTNGGSEAIALVAGAVGGTVAAEPEFSLHPRGAGGPRWRSNPSNPGGRLAAPDDCADVWDEAFYPLASGAWTRGDAGCIVVGSLTKVFACPGLRLGYVLADDARRLTAAQPAWPVGSIALAVLPELLAAADLVAWRDAIRAQRTELVDLLAGHGLVVRAHDAPWVLAEAPQLRDRLARQGVVVRDCASFGLPGTVRIAVPDERGLVRLQAALTVTSPCGGRRPGATPARAERRCSATLAPTIFSSGSTVITTILFDIGDTLVRAAAPGTPIDGLVAEPLEAVRPTLRALAGSFRLGAVTDTSLMTAQDVRLALAGSGLAELLEVIVTSHDIGAPKPDPRGIEFALARLGVEAAATLFVGDAEVDEGAARAAGTAFARTGGGRTLAGVVRQALTDLMGPFRAALALVGPTNPAAVESALVHQARLTKPPGALGQLETLGTQLAAIAGEHPPPLPAPAAVAVFAGDHGVVAEGVTPWPQEVTAQMVANFVAGGAAINVLARQAGATVMVVDVGVATDLDVLGLDGAPGLLRRNIRAGTGNLAVGPAMTTAEARRAMDTGAEVAARLVGDGARALVTGEMGIGNTTPSAALIAALLGCRPAQVTGRGTGIDDEMLKRKVAVVERAVARVPLGADPVVVLAEVGGLEIAGLAGLIVGGASQRVPVVVDGVVAGAALLVAHALCPAVLPYVIAGHRSTEPGATAVLAHLGVEPVLDLGLRLGEGSGACLALGVIEAAARILREMATFDSAAVKDAR